MELIIPRNPEAESAVLGGLLLQPELWDTLNPNADWFAVGNHVTLFAAMQELRRKGTEPDIATLAPILGKRGIPSAASWLTGITEGALTFQAEPSAKQLRLCAMKRKAIYAAQKLMEQASNPMTNEDDLRVSAEQIAASLESPEDAETVYVGDVVALRAKELHDGIDRNGLKTGLRELDAIVGGFRDGELVVIGARASMGKTQFALELLRRLSTPERPGLLFSLETNSKSIADRLIARDTGYDMWQVRSASMFGKKIAQQISPQLYTMPLFIVDRRGLKVSDVAAIARKTKRKYGNLGPVAIDYLTLLDMSQDNRNIEVERTANQLQALAGELDVPVILLSQLSRAVEQRSNKRPQLSDLRDSGGIEQAAHIVMLLYREAYYSGKEDTTLEVIVAKSKDGPTGVVKLAYVPDKMRIEGLTQP